VKICVYVTRFTRVLLVDQELLILPEHLDSSPVFSGVRVTRSLVLCACFIDRCLFFCTLSFWPLCWYLQSLLDYKPLIVNCGIKTTTVIIYCHHKGLGCTFQHKAKTNGVLL